MSVIVSIVLLGAVCSALAFIVMFALIAEVGPMRMTTVTYLNPAVAIAAGALILGERITVWTLIGFALVLAGSYLVPSGTARAAKPAGTPRAGGLGAPRCVRSPCAPSAVRRPTGHRGPAGRMRTPRRPSAARRSSPDPSSARPRGGRRSRAGSRCPARPSRSRGRCRAAPPRRRPPDPGPDRIARNRRERTMARITPGAMPPSSRMPPSTPSTIGSGFDAAPAPPAAPGRLPPRRAVRARRPASAVEVGAGVAPSSSGVSGSSTATGAE